MNRSLWRTLAERAGDGLAAVAPAFACTVVTLSLLVLLLVALPWVFKPLSGLLLLAAAGASYFMDELGVLVDEDMVRNVLQTDGAEAGELASPRLLLHLLLFGLLPLLLVAWTRIEYRGLRRELAGRAALLLLCAAVTAGVLVPTYKEAALLLRANGSLRLMLNPFAPLGALVAGLRQAGSGPPAELRRVAPDAQRVAGHAQPPLLFVFVLGETASAQHFALNGYERDTNPELSREDVLVFTDVTACGTSTATAVPCMFSSLGREAASPELARRSENVLDILQRVGVDVLWRDNNSGSKGVADRVAYEDVSAACPDGLRVGDNGCYDEALLDGLQALVDAHPGDLCLVLHQKGSHGPSYARRTPPAWKRFLPECDQPDVQNCSREELVNAYDNTILYTDHVLAEVIHLLQRNADRRRAAMLYVSDHGESLGEHGVYLHGFPFCLAPEEQKHVPLVFWGSESFWSGSGLVRAGVEAGTALPLSHDAIFHTLLGLFDVRCASYVPALDLLAPGRLPRLAAGLSPR